MVSGARLTALRFLGLAHPWRPRKRGPKKVRKREKERDAMTEGRHHRRRDDDHTAGGIYFPPPREVPRPRPEPADWPPPAPPAAAAPSPWAPAATGEPRTARPDDPAGHPATAAMDHARSSESSARPSPWAPGDDDEYSEYPEEYEEED